MSVCVCVCLSHYLAIFVKGLFPFPVLSVFFRLCLFLSVWGFFGIGATVCTRLGIQFLPYPGFSLEGLDNCLGFEMSGFLVNSLVPQDKNVCLGEPAYYANRVESVAVAVSVSVVVGFIGFGPHISRYLVCGII